MRQVVLDTETTGLSWEKGNRVVEIGCVELLERRPTGRTFHRYLNPGPGCQFEAGFCQFRAKNGRFSAIIEGLHVLGYGKPDNSTDAIKWGPRDISSRR